MKTPRFFNMLLAAWIAVTGIGPGAWANPTLNGHQDTVNKDVDAEKTSTAWSIPDDSIKTTMNASEYNNFKGAKAYADLNNQYTLGPNDVIDIMVMRHAEVSGEYIINSEGKIQYEFVGDVTLAGFNKEQAVKELAKRLSMYIIKPEINLKISGYNSKVVYVVGEVATPGKVIMHGDTITVRDALLAAGLPLIGSAATDSASLFTPSSSGKITRRKVNVEALLYKGDLRENFIMRPGDCLYIPATFLTKAMRMISPVTTPIAQVAGTGGATKAAF